MWKQTFKSNRTECIYVLLVENSFKCSNTTVVNSLKGNSSTDDNSDDDDVMDDENDDDDDDDTSSNSLRSPAKQGSC